MPPTSKTPKTAAERMKSFRLRMTEEQKILSREKNKEAKRCARMKWSSSKKKEEKELAMLRMRKIRNDRKESGEGSKNMENAPPYGSIQSLGKAVKRVSDVLPNSPRKKNAVLKKLVVKFNVIQKSINPTSPVLSDLEKKVVDFYNLDTISRQLPGRKDFVTIKVDGIKQRIQKKVLTMTVMEVYQQFKMENQHLKIGKSKFASLRPQNVVPVCEKDHNVCCCIYHENFELLVNAMKKSLPLLPSSEDLIKSATCSHEKSCYMGECLACSDTENMIAEYFPEFVDYSTKCEYSKWESDKKVILFDSLLNLKKILISSLPIMKKHVYIAKIQLTQIKKLKLTLHHNEAILQEDFSENYNIKQQNEIMTAHWASSGVTLFTAVVTTQAGSKSYAIISDELHHDKYAVSTFNKALGQKICEEDPNISSLHIFSDGAGSQFKNRFSISNLLHSDCIHANISEVDWSFFGTAHGKGPVDGVGGTVKRAIWRRVLNEKIIINTAAEFATAAENACPNISIIYVGADQVTNERNRLELIWEKKIPHAIPHIRSYHFFKPVSKFAVEAMDISPFMDTVCPSSTIVSVFDDTEDSSELSNDSNIEPLTSSKENLTSGTDKSSEVNVKNEMYYAVDFIDRYYIGRVLGAAPRSGFWKMKFLHRSRTDGILHFVWPKTDDIDDVHQSTIFHGPIELKGCGDFTIPNIDKLDKIFEEL